MSGLSTSISSVIHYFCARQQLKWCTISHFVADILAQITAPKAEDIRTRTATNTSYVHSKTLRYLSGRLTRTDTCNILFKSSLLFRIQFKYTTSASLKIIVGVHYVLHVHMLEYSHILQVYIAFCVRTCLNTLTFCRCTSHSACAHA